MEAGSSASLSHGGPKDSFRGVPDDSLQKVANWKNNAQITAAPVGDLSSLQLEQLIKDGFSSRHLDSTHVPVSTAAMHFDLEGPFSEPEEYYRPFVPKHNTVSGLAGAITSVPTHPTTSTLHFPTNLESIPLPRTLAKSRKKPSPRDSPAKRTAWTNDTAEEHDSITSLPHVPTQERRSSRTSTMSSMVSAISFQGLGAIYIQPSKELNTMQSISNLRAKLQDMTSLGKPWARPDSRNGVHTASSSPSSIANISLRSRVHEAHTRLNQAINVPSQPTNRLSTQEWTGPSEWIEPSSTAQGPKEWIEDFLNRKEEADRAESALRMQEQNKGILSRSKSIHKLKSRLNKTRLFDDKTTQEQSQTSDPELPQLPRPQQQQPRRNMSLRRSISIRVLCSTTSLKPDQHKLHKSPRSHRAETCPNHQCVRIRSLPSLGPGTSPVSDVFSEDSDSVGVGVKGPVTRISESLREGFMCLGRRVSFRRGVGRGV
ncbi:hypothetical protein TUN199_05832 [Pyrenophora tritici-repentis]|uniref:Uncharacterized protein n=2 Tax=Pyrenophora tritici-repentis TaxID=45151 RepID=A0A2W1FKH3_9PLEO|nr:uncharacterized protein PTRG_11108 [Pyrenophora tritici-repentis Pt-1C-BFP]KAF7575674.1 hypothetical protein PtrM4_072980 [Pyrenophora tritici-repentis]EDU44158.1 predicted protein [Pyrenophora tritici-repentis Pt-1C-BFP]KAI0576590.1 hypothetical protein Alg215_07401 [Pyrenophora tritici-repentis]KAI0622173.1 hypothetical protein TUN199_05832 [Pyrenophora tritici-repentis]KAI1514589.1 hypothetical protein Ptr86124_005912 [Pyrenophora tritici-repentis]